MHWESIYVHPNNVTEENVFIETEECRHLRVLRKKKDDFIWAVDGKGTAYYVQLVALQKDKATGKIQQIRRKLGETATHITLAQGIIKGDRFDWLIEKSTEMGVSQIVPMTTAKTIVKASPQKINRWNRVALAAMKQCGRTVLPEVTQSRTLIQVLALSAGFTHTLIAECSDESRPLSHYIKSEPPSKIRKVLLLSGPEGGFSRDEIVNAKSFKARLVHLGNRRLRAETAGLVLLTLAQNQLDELL